jgi:hypothetical protein
VAIPIVVLSGFASAGIKKISVEKEIYSIFKK